MKIYYVLTIILNLIVLGVLINIQKKLLKNYDGGYNKRSIEDLWKEISEIFYVIDRLDTNTTEKLLCEKYIEAEVDAYFGTTMKTKEILCGEEIVKVNGGKYYKVLKTLKKIDDEIEYRVKEI